MWLLGLAGPVLVLPEQVEHRARPGRTAPMAHRGLLVHQALLALENQVLQEPAEPLARTVQAEPVARQELVKKAIREAQEPMERQERVERLGQMEAMVLRGHPGQVGPVAWMGLTGLPA